MNREPLERVLQPAIDEARIAANWQRIRNGSVKRTSEIPRWSLGVAFACAAAVALFFAWPSHIGPLGSPVAAVGAGELIDAPADRRVAFDDDSRLELERGSRLQVLTNDGERFVAQLQRGRAHFDVHPGGPRRWEIETSRATVEVVGTAFSVEADEHHVVVKVERGVVMVRGEHVPNRVVRLTAGQQISLDDTRSALDEVVSPSVATNGKPAVVTAAAPSAPTAPVDAVKTAPAPVEVAQPAAPSATSAKLATTAKTKTAKTPKTPTPALTPTKKDVATLADALAVADQRRDAGQPADAASILEHALVGARRDESAGMAEFMLGRLYLEDLGDPDRAQAAFARMIDNGSPTQMLEDARAHRIEALVRAHRTADAAAALAEYDRLYPQGVHHSKLHTLISK